MNRLRKTLVLSLTAAAFGLAACDDPTTIEDHLEVEGIAIEEGGVEIYRYMLDDGTVPPLTLSDGMHDVVFFLLDHDGLPISEADHDEEHEEHELRITIDDNTVLAWTAEAGEHPTVQFHGQLSALQEGTTEMEVCVPHGTHCDFRVVVPVSVVAVAQ